MAVRVPEDVEHGGDVAREPLASGFDLAPRRASPRDGGIQSGPKA
jgi:hypothetical protein